MDDVITLISESVKGYDKYGNEIRTGEQILTDQTDAVLLTKAGQEIAIYGDGAREVFCQIHGITRAEFYQAATADMHPEIVARLSDYMDYQGETEAIYDGTRYSIIRTYRDAGSMGRGSGLPFGGIELVLERKIGDE